MIKDKNLLVKFLRKIKNFHISCIFSPANPVNISIGQISRKEAHMKDSEIIALYFARDEKAIRESDRKYGALCRTIAKNILDNYCRSDFVKFAINGAILGLCIHNVEHHLSYVETLVTSLGVGLGLMVTMCIFAKLKDEPVDEEAIPASFRGLPIALLTAGMISLALMALQFKF